jgi:hypothetical protein
MSDLYCQKKSNFVVGGKTGDFLHCLYVVRGICEKFGSKANIYITDNSSYGGDNFSFNINKTFDDLNDLVLNQDYTSYFSILNQKIDNFVNLNSWRQYHQPNNWTNKLSKLYNIPICNNGWISCTDKDIFFKDKVVIHKSTVGCRSAKNFPWKSILKNNDCVFITSDQKEYDVFPFKNLVGLHKWKNFYEQAKIINSSKFFIGNESSSLALAHGLGVPRLAELMVSNQYVGEEKVLNNFFYISNKESNINGLEKFISIPSILIKLF